MTASTIAVDGRELRLTNLDKVLYPAVGFTKAAALDYYARIAPVLLPHIRGRPMTLKRYPYGVAGPHFYDKHCAGRPDWLPVAPMWSERKGEDIDFCRLDDAASLLAGPREALERVEEHGDLFSPILTCVQRLPAG